jgi:hypothetical protein
MKELLPRFNTIIHSLAIIVKYNRRIFRVRVRRKNAYFVSFLIFLFPAAVKFQMTRTLADGGDSRQSAKALNVKEFISFISAGSRDRDVDSPHLHGRNFLSVNFSNFLRFISAIADPIISARQLTD